MKKEKPTAIRRPAPGSAPPDKPTKIEDALRDQARDHQARREELWTKIAVVVAGLEVPTEPTTPGVWAGQAVEDFDAFFGAGS